MMELSVFLITFSALWKIIHSVRCYKCEPVGTDNMYQQDALCQDFDGSAQYVTDCTFSTMCYKREISLNVGDGVTKVVKRGCTPQTLPGYQEKIGREWIQVDKIHEAYDEDCKMDSKEGRITTSLSCYCRGDLCNGAVTIDRNVLFIVLGVVLSLFLGSSL